MPYGIVLVRVRVVLGFRLATIYMVNWRTTLPLPTATGHLKTPQNTHLEVEVEVEGSLKIQN